MKRGIVSHWKVALIPYSSGSMQPELSERAARLLRSQVPRLFSCFRSFHQCIQSTCVENCETVTTSSCISYARKVLQSKLMTVLHIMSDRTRTHTHRAAAMIEYLIRKDFWNTTEIADVQGIHHFLAVAPKTSKAWKRLSWHDSSVRLLPSGKTVYSWLMDRSCGSMNSCICWRHQELFVLIPSQALR